MSLILAYLATGLIRFVIALMIVAYIVTLVTGAYTAWKYYPRRDPKWRP